MVTPSLVMVGAPNFLSRTTLRPRGPRVTLTVSASALTPCSSRCRASSEKLRIFDMCLFYPFSNDRPGRACRSVAVVSTPGGAEFVPSLGPHWVGLSLVVSPSPAAPWSRCRPRSAGTLSARVLTDTLGRPLALRQGECQRVTLLRGWPAGRPSLRQGESHAGHNW